MEDIKRKSVLEANYIKGRLQRDAFLGEYFIYTSDHDDSKIICIEKLFNEKEALMREVEAKKKKILNKHDYLINILDWSVEVQLNWCSTFYLLRVFYEFPGRNLKKEILSRKELQSTLSGFSMIELTHFLYSQVLVNKFLQEKGVYHGDISPSSIFVSTKGEFKLAWRVNEVSSPERVQIDKSIKGDPLYLAPTVFETVKNRTIEQRKHNSHKADMFALGLSILEAGLMRSVQGIYGNDNSGFQAKALEDLLNEFENKYLNNPLLFTSVRKMLEVDEENRPDFVNLVSALPEYEIILDYFYKLEHGLIEDDHEEPQHEQQQSSANQAIEPMTTNPEKDTQLRIENQASFFPKSHDYDAYSMGLNDPHFPSSNQNQAVLPGQHAPNSLRDPNALPNESDRRMSSNQQIDEKFYFDQPSTQTTYRDLDRTPIKFITDVAQLNDQEVNINSLKPNLGWIGKSPSDRSRANSLNQGIDDQRVEKSNADNFQQNQPNLDLGEKPNHAFESEQATGRDQLHPYDYEHDKSLNQRSARTVEEDFFNFDPESLKGLYNQPTLQTTVTSPPTNLFASEFVQYDYAKPDDLTFNQQTPSYFAGLPVTNVNQSPTHHIQYRRSNSEYPSLFEDIPSYSMRDVFAYSPAPKTPISQDISYQSPMSNPSYFSVPSNPTFYPQFQQQCIQNSPMAYGPSYQQTYQEVMEETFERGAYGELIRRITIKYIPVQPSVQFSNPKVSFNHQINQINNPIYGYSPPIYY